MTIVERGSVIIIEGTNISAGFQQAVTDETGCRIICLDPEAGERVVAVIPPEPPRVWLTSAEHENFVADMGGNPEASVGVALGVEPVTDTDEKFPVVPDIVRKRAEWAADMIGVTKHSDMRVHVVQAAICALMNDDRQYTIGDETMKKVFEPNKIQNLSDLQPVLDAVEAALQPEDPVVKAAEDEYSKILKAVLPIVYVKTFSVVDDIVRMKVVERVEFLTFEEIINVLRPYINVRDIKVTDGVVSLEGVIQRSPAVEPDPTPDPVELHRAALEAHIEAEKYADAISALPADFQSEGREMMLNEYFERQRKAVGATRATQLRYRDIPEGEKNDIWAARSMWHYHVKARHAQILRILTDQ